MDMTVVSFTYFYRHGHHCGHHLLLTSIDMDITVFIICSIDMDISVVIIFTYFYRHGHYCGQLYLLL